MVTALEAVLSVVVPILIASIFSRENTQSNSQPRSISRHFYSTFWGFLFCALGLIWYTCWQWRESWEPSEWAYSWLLRRKPGRGKLMGLIAQFMPGCVSDYSYKTYMSGSIASVVKNFNPILFDRLKAPEGFVLYRMFGPVLGQCHWCEAQNVMSLDLHLYLACRIMLSHAANALLIVIFSPQTIPEARGWRTMFLCVALVGAVVDVFGGPSLPAIAIMLYGNPSPPSFWDMLYRRMLILLGIDVSFAAAMLLTATGYFKIPSNLSISGSMTVCQQQLQGAINDLTFSRKKLRLASALRATVRDNEEYSKMQREFWQAERDRTAEYKSQPNVAEAVARIMSDTTTKDRRRIEQAFVDQTF